MALPYPDEEVFFRRSALTTEFFDPAIPEHFFGHVLIEYAWNAWDMQNAPDQVHPRSIYRNEAHGRK